MAFYKSILLIITKNHFTLKSTNNQKNSYLCTLKEKQEHIDG